MHYYALGDRCVRMKIVEIGPGTAPIEWQGESAQYVGIDPEYKTKQIIDTAAEVLLKNVDISNFGLIPHRIEVVESPAKPDAVYMRNVLFGNKYPSHNFKLAKNAVRIAKGCPIFILESRDMHHKSLVRVREELAASQKIDSRILFPRDLGFRAIWNQVSESRSYTKNSRILFIPPQFSVA